MAVTEAHTGIGHSLDRLYDIPLEARRLRESFPPPADMQRFLYGEAVNFLLEHAGYVPFSEVEGELTPEGRFMMQGLDMEDSWQRSVERYGFGSREHYEVIGYQEALKLLRASDTDMVALSSPSKEGYADRRFTFTFVKVPNGDGSHRIIQTNIMHRHDDVDFSQAKAQFGAMQDVDGFLGKRTEPAREEEMLVQPLPFHMRPNTREEVFTMLDLSAEKIAESRAYEQLVQQELGDYITFFIQNMKALAHVDPETQPKEYMILVDQAKNCRDYLFEQAQKLREVGASGESRGSDAAATVQGHFDDHARPLFYGTLVCDTQTSMSFAELMAAGYSPSDAAYYSTQLAPAHKEEWRDKSKWPKGDCRAPDKGGCGAKDVKVGPCSVCEKCQATYDAGKVPGVIY